jgi:DNA-binding NarL/FixJ family response regulator
MFNNVLIAEDYQSTKLSIEYTLKQLGIAEHAYAYDCDAALLTLKHAIRTDKPLELLITDLSFAEDRTRQIVDGTALIQAAKSLQPGLKILVFSAESNSAVINSLFDKFDINGYVPKGKRDTIELREAIEKIYKGKKHFPTDLQYAVKIKNAHDFTAYDIAIISQLAAGTSQKNIPYYLAQNNIKPSGLSSVEKRLNFIKETLDFSKNEQLIAYCKDNKII